MPTLPRSLPSGLATGCNCNLRKAAMCCYPHNQVKACVSKKETSERINIFFLVGPWEEATKGFLKDQRHKFNIMVINIIWNIWKE
jgi:hypothetical protein